MSEKLPFSKRYGIRPARKPEQDTYLDDDLRNSLYNLVYATYMIPNREASLTCKKELMNVLISLWVNHLKKPADEIPTFWSDVCLFFKVRILEGYYADVYDLIEFLPNNYVSSSSYSDNPNTRFMSTCNEVLQREFAAYRFVNGLITRLTSQSEIEEVEKALESPIEVVNSHFKSALQLFSVKSNPDYRNSIKESISAVEALCQAIVGRQATLGQALGVLSDKGIELPTSLKQAYEKLYGWSSSEEGIRHAMLTESKLEVEDARYVLVVCAAFANYLIEKSQKAGIKLRKDRMNASQQKS